MLSKLGKIGLSAGLWFGNKIVLIFEKIFPSFKDKDENIHGIKDHYLQEFNLSRKERIKRNLKLLIRIYFSIIFWLFLTYTLFNYIFSGFNPIKLEVFIIFSVIFLVLSLIVLAKITL